MHDTIYSEKKREKHLNVINIKIKLIIINVELQFNIQIVRI